MKNPITLRVGSELSLAAARAKIRALLAEAEHPASITVILPAGIYSPSDFRFTAEDCAADCPVAYIGEDGAVIHGGLTIPAEKWQAPDDEMAARFPVEAREHIRMVPLGDYGLNADDWGELPAIGAYETSSRYDGAYQGCGCEVFCGRRMMLARYPNAGSFNKLAAVWDVGDCYEFPPQNYIREWNDRRNHRGGTYVLDRETSARAKGWKNPTEGWMFGYFMHDWADSSTPIEELDAEHRLVKPRYVSRYGAKAGALYYFYNIPEELDVPGEWYLDRKGGYLYFYPFEGCNSLDFSYSDKPLISCEDTCRMTFSGFRLLCTMKDAVVSRGNDMTFENLTITNVAGSGVSVNGYRNLVSGCDISHTGKGGIKAEGGIRETLIPGENRVTNNYIHDFSEIYLTYQPGVNLSGVGNRCDHNEICNSPHMAIGYGGNEHLIEFNDIHHVVLKSSDAGAIYAGQNWTAHGTVIRYNLLRAIGGEGFEPDGIYWDDGHSGQSAYGNILIGIGKNGFLVGGGRENIVNGNIIIDCERAPISYDARYRDGFIHDGWARAAVNRPDSMHWRNLRAVPYKEGVWLEKYPRLSVLKTDLATDPDDIEFPINPAYSSVCGNVIIDAKGRLGTIDKSLYTYSKVEGNVVYTSREAAGWNEETLSLKPDSPVFADIPGFEAIPAGQIGRHKA